MPVAASRGALHFCSTCCTCEGPKGVTRMWRRATVSACPCMGAKLAFCSVLGSIQSGAGRGEQGVALMADGRSKRSIRTPRRFDDDDVVYDPQINLADRARDSGTKRWVYRLLKRKSVLANLLGQKVYCYWPDDKQWYEGVVQEVRPKQAKLCLFYPADGSSEEDVDVAALVRDGHIAVKQERAHGQPLHKGDIPVDEQDRLTATFIEGEITSGDEEPDGDMTDEVYRVSDDEGYDSADADFDEPDSEQERRRRNERLKAAAARAAATKGQPQLNRNSKRYKESASVGPASVKRAKQNMQQGAPYLKLSTLLPSPRSEVAAAEDFKNALLGALIHQLGPAGHAPPSRTGGAGSHMGMGRNGPISGASADLYMRRKAQEQLIGALQVAADELSKEGVASTAIAKPGAVGVAVEDALYKANGGLTKEYKARFRSLMFNLKDVANPHLRARVLQGELAPDALVVLDPTELASQQLSAWREKKAEEMTKAKFLDEEAAARISTAAAAAMKDHRQMVLQQVSNKLLASREGEEGQPAAGKAEDVAPVEEKGNWEGSPAADGLEGTAPVLLLRTASETSLPLKEEPMMLGLDVNGTLILPPLLDETLPAGMGPRDGSTDLTTAATGSGHRVAKLASMKPVVPEPMEEEYNPDDFLVGGDEPPVRAAASDRKPPTPGHGHVHEHAQGGHSHAHAAPSPSSQVADLLPVVAAPEPNTPAAAVQPGTQVWKGGLRSADFGNWQIVVDHLGGLAELALLLPSSSHGLEIKGTSRLDKVEEFFEELRTKSRSRVVTMGLLHMPDTTAANATLVAGEVDQPVKDSSGLSRLIDVYQGKQRAGVFHPTRGLEGYLLPRSRLAQRLLRTARLVATPQVVHLLPAEVPLGQLLLVVVHRRDWKPPAPTPTHAHAPRAHVPAPAPVPTHPSSLHAPSPSSGVLGMQPSGGSSWGGDPRASTGPASAPPQPSTTPPDPLGAPPALGSLLAQLGQALGGGQGLPAGPPPHQQTPYQHAPAHHGQSLEAPPAGHGQSMPALDTDALSKLAASLQGALPPPAMPHQHYQMQQMPQGAPPPQMGGHPMMVAQPDGSYTMLQQGGSGGPHEQQQQGYTPQEPPPPYMQQYQQPGPPPYSGPDPNAAPWQGHSSHGSPPPPVGYPQQYPPPMGHGPPPYEGDSRAPSFNPSQYPPPGQGPAPHVGDPRAPFTFPQQYPPSNHGPYEGDPRGAPPPGWGGPPPLQNYGPPPPGPESHQYDQPSRPLPPHPSRDYRQGGQHGFHGPPPSNFDRDRGRDRDRERDREPHWDRDRDRDGGRERDVDRDRDRDGGRVRGRGRGRSSGLMMPQYAPDR